MCWADDAHHWLCAADPHAAVGCTDGRVLESLVCQAIRRGESAPQVARRLTGDSRNTYQTWFQIRNASSRFVPKSQYNAIRAGWRACLLKPASSARLRRSMTSSQSEAPDVSQATRLRNLGGAARRRRRRSPPMLGPCGGRRKPGSAARARAVRGRIMRAIGVLDLTMLWLGAAVVVPWLGWRIVDDYLARRKTASIIVGSFAHRFVDEFERPLVRTTRGASRESRVSAAARDAGDSTFFSRRAREGVIRTCRTTRRTSNTTSPGSCTCSPMTPS